jgi:hypothetical protein
MTSSFRWKFFFGLLSVIECGSVFTSVKKMIEALEKTSDKESDRVNASSDNSISEREGSLAGWLTVVGSSLVYFSAFGIINSFGFFQDIYQNRYLSSTPSSTIAFIGTIQITLMNVLAAPAGSLFDCYGLKVRESCQSRYHQRRMILR